MAELLWHALPFILIALVLGGVIGAFLYAVITPYFNYKPVIAKRVDVLPQFEAPGGAAELRSQLILSNGDQSYPYKNLYVVHIEITNESTHNFDEFELGISLEAKAAIIYIEAQAPDRHCVVKTLTPLSFTEPRSQLDMSLQPLNRTDTYRFRMFIVAPEEFSPSTVVTLSSGEAVRFVSLPSTEEILKTAAKSISLPLGPFKLSFR